MLLSALTGITRQVLESQPGVGAKLCSLVILERTVMSYYSSGTHCYSIQTYMVNRTF